LPSVTSWGRGSHQNALSRPFTFHARVHRPKQIAGCWYRSTALGKEGSEAIKGENFSTDDQPDVLARLIVALLIDRKKIGFWLVDARLDKIGEFRVVRMPNMIARRNGTG
jgi:hypothetical protein